MKSLLLTVLAVFFACLVQGKPNQKWVQHIEDTFQTKFMGEVQIPWSDKSVTAYEVFAIPTVLDTRATEMLVPNGASDKEFKDCMASSVFSAGYIEGLMERLQQKTLEQNPHI